MDQFFLLPTSVYNKILITQSVTKRELSKQQLSLSPMYQIDSLTQEVNKKLFSKPESLVDNFFSCPLIKLSNLQTLYFDAVGTGISLLDSAQQLRRKNANVLDIYFTLLDAAG